MKAKDKLEIPTIGEKTRKLWNFSAIMWTVVYYSVNILAVSSSILIIFIEHFYENSDFMIILLSAISIVLSFVGILINFRQQITRYRRAFNIVNRAMLNYYAHPNDPNRIDAIVNAISYGEDIIDNSYDVESSLKREIIMPTEKADGLSENENQTKQQIHKT